MSSYKSRFSYGGRTEVGGRFAEWWEKKKLPQDSASDFIFVVPAEFAGRPDLIAVTVYGDSRLMWVVLQFNKIIDFTTELAAGTVLVLPTAERLQSLIGAKFSTAESTRTFVPGVVSR